jgi:uncharacterized protein YfaS (alpha-2-macroglobulin family)
MVTLLFFISLVGMAAAATQHQINLWCARDIAPSSKIRLVINTQNVPTVHLFAAPIDGEKWLETEFFRNNPRPSVVGEPVIAWDASIAQKGQVPNPNNADTYYSRQINLPPLKPGVYLIQASFGTTSAWAVVNVTHLAVIAKRSPKHLLVWVTDALTGKIVPDAQIKLVTKDRTVVHRSVTGQDGVSMTAIQPGVEALIVSKGADMAGMPSDSTNPNGRLIAHFQTDRPVYRPGQTVSYKAILRHTLDQAYSVVADRAVDIELRDPRENVIDHFSTKTNAMGSVIGTFDIPSEGMIGNYTIVVNEGKQQVFDSFVVAEYRKPEYQVAVTPVKPRYLAGDEVVFNVNASYYFGAPVPNAIVHYTVRSDANPYYSPASSEFFNGNYGARDTYRENAVVADDNAETDDKGNAKIVVKTSKNLPDSMYQIDVTVTDGSRRQVMASGSVPVFQSSIRIGMKTDVIVATLGSLIPIDLKAIDLDGAPVSAHVHLKVVREDWDSEKDEPKEVVVADTRVLVPPTGSLRYSLPARSEGDLVIRATAQDSSGRLTEATLDVEVAGNFGRNIVQQRGPVINVRMDKATYKPGDVARAFITTNVPKNPILVVNEGQDIWGYRVIDVAKAGQLCSFPTDKAMSPNCYVDAVQWTKGQMIASNGNVLLPDPARRLRITITPDKSDYRPGDKAKMTVHVQDAKGHPVSAEVSLAVVDESIFAVSPETTQDPYDVFWSPRNDGVSTQMSAPEELSGGAYQSVPSTAPVRTRFADTALWAGIVQTDANGKATLSFEMPGNLTTWRATAYGSTVETNVGRGLTSVLANRPVMLRLATPRQLVQGDTLKLIGTVNNRSDAAHHFQVRLKADGLDLIGNSVLELDVPAKGEGHLTWMLNPKTIPASGVATLKADVVALDHQTADYGDALQVSVPIVPKGVMERTLVGGVLGKSAKFGFDLPADRIEPASVVSLEVRGNLDDVVRTSAESLIQSPRYGPPVAANQLTAAASTHQPANRREVRDAIAMLARDQSGSGWGWWADDQASAAITSKVLRALLEAKAAGLPVYKKMLEAAIPGAESIYDENNIWESRALLTASLAEAKSKRAEAMFDEVVRRAEKQTAPATLSPFALLRLAEAGRSLSKKQELVQSLIDKALSLRSEGPESAYIPVGDGPGWTTSSVEATAEALVALVRTRSDARLQAKLARWLALPEEGAWRNEDEDAATIRALAAYAQRHPSATTMGEVTLKVNGQEVPTTPDKVGQGATARIPRDLLKNGRNAVEITRSESGETFFTLESRVFRPKLNETTKGIRVLRRFEVQNAAGVWTELNRSVKAGEPVRVTLVAWGDDLADAVRVTEPLPSGFEFVSDESETQGREEVRDGAVIQYLVNQGQPQSFRYYLRAESEGRLTALPAKAEFLRRPADNGQSQTVPIIVVGDEAPAL